jgi:hypothetical protein
MAIMLTAKNTMIAVIVNVTTAVATRISIVVITVTEDAATFKNDCVKVRVTFA